MQEYEYKNQVWEKEKDVSMLNVLSKKQIGVIGAGSCASNIKSLAELIGKEIARRGSVLICGGLGGVMEAAAWGAKQEGGVTLGILPGIIREEANPWIDIAVLSGMGHTRNVLIAQSSDALMQLMGSMAPFRK